MKLPSIKRLVLLCSVLLLTLQLAAGARSNDCCLDCPQMMCDVAGCDSCPMLTLPTTTQVWSATLSPSLVCQPLERPVSQMPSEVWRPPD